MKRSQGGSAGASRDKADSWYMIDTQLEGHNRRRFKIYESGAGKIHFPVGTSEEYLKGLASETLITDNKGCKILEKDKPESLRGTA